MRSGSAERKGSFLMRNSDSALPACHLSRSSLRRSTSLCRRAEASRMAKSRSAIARRASASVCAAPAHVRLLPVGVAAVVLAVGRDSAGGRAAVALLRGFRQLRVPRRVPGHRQHELVVLVTLLRGLGERLLVLLLGRGKHLREERVAHVADVRLPQETGAALPDCLVPRVLASLRPLRVG